MAASSAAGAVPWSWEAEGKGREHSWAVQERAAGKGKASLCLGATWENGCWAGLAREPALHGLSKTPPGGTAVAL